ncbi:hypothetical protein MLD38_000439 [Melastoma candidum]|uniref:Uncharacterized protein n=1 Tax=Melastoma candidum TaxID=119954 RepID=A0ACB9SIQ1_9MYRT|nr:hypothetical protein MLD38_000439 [Melastoma candidum]
MEAVNRVLSLLMKATNNNAVIHTCLGCSFIALCVRSINQQKEIEALEAQKESLVNSNKAMKKTVWEWKQQLYAEASTDAALVPLAQLQAIFGEAPGNAEKDGSSSSNIVV